MSQPGFKNYLTKLRVSLSPGSVDRSCEIALAAIGVLAKEDLGPPSSTPTRFEMTTHRSQPKAALEFIPITFPQ